MAINHLPHLNLLGHPFLGLSATAAAVHLQQRSDCTYRPGRGGLRVNCQYARKATRPHVSQLQLRNVDPAQPETLVYEC